MEEIIADVVIIGSGPAGQKAAIQAAKLGKNVIIIERDFKAGGACLFSGTIPSKTFREAVLDLTRYYDSVYYTDEFVQPTVEMSDLNHRILSVVEDEATIIFRQFKKNGIRVIQGSARFENQHTLIIIDENYRLRYQIKAEFYIIATGSNPRRPHDVPFDEEVILDSTTLLDIKKIPKSMIVLGGGIIGSEYASFFATLGTEVTVIDRKDHMLPFIDNEIGIHLQTALTELGLKFLGEKEPEVVAKVDGRAMVRCTDGTELHADILLYALGRVANVESLHIGNAGLTVDYKGYIPVNAMFQTSVPHIYAVGDVVGGPCLASTSMEQGRLAARNLCHAEMHYFPTFFPYGIYTIPEISFCGYTEEELKAKGYHYEVGRAYYYEIARSHIAGSKTGLFKILFHAETLEILGVHIIGRSATEVIHIGQMAISFRAHLDYFVDHVFNYPTYAEGYRIAALNGLNKIRKRK